MYASGLDLQQKLDKIIDYDRCNPDQVKDDGLKNYCKSLFQENKFTFWSQSDLNKTCNEVEKSMVKKNDECAALNEHVHGKYNALQKKVLFQIEDLIRGKVDKKLLKKQRLAKFVEEQQQVSEESADNSTETLAPPPAKVQVKNNTNQTLSQQICQFGTDSNDKPLQVLCRHNPNESDLSKYLQRVDKKSGQ